MFGFDLPGRGAELDELFAAVDSDGSGEIDFAEFCLMMTGQMKRLTGLRWALVVVEEPPPPPEPDEIQATPSTSSALKKSAHRRRQRASTECFVSKPRGEELYWEMDGSNPDGHRSLARALATKVEEKVVSARVEAHSDAKRKLNQNRAAIRQEVSTHD